MGVSERGEQWSNNAPAGESVAEEMGQFVEVAQLPARTHGPLARSQCRLLGVELLSMLKEEAEHV